MTERLNAAFSGSSQALSISDDDLCSECEHCIYKPGETSLCHLNWPGLFDADGYCRECPLFRKK